MSDGERRPRDPDEPFTGHAVVNGVVRFTSVSQMKLFDKASDGCPRKWAFAYRFGIKLARTGALEDGAEFGKSLEHYLKTGEDLLPPKLRPAKHLFPAPGGDLEVERKFATGVKGKDIELAIAARERLVKHTSVAEREQLRAEIKKYARLVICDVPVDGAADVRHHRGVFVDEDGKLRGEVPGMIVGETIDLKMVTRIHPQVIKSGDNAGTVLPSYAKNAAEICEDIQMLGYGVYDADTHPELTHVRLGHVYGNKSKLEAEKRTGLISIDQLRERFRRRVEPVILGMIDVAQAERIEDVEPNLCACDSFTHVDPANPNGRPKKGCGYIYQCPLSTTQIATNMFGNSEARGMSMSLFDTIGQQDEQAAPTQAAPAPPHDEMAYRAQVEAEKAKLAGVPSPPPVPPPLNTAQQHPGALGIKGYEPNQPCNGRGWYAAKDGSGGFILVELGHKCHVCAVGVPAQVPPPPPPPSLIATPPSPIVTPPPPPAGALVPAEGAFGVKPPDAPTVDWIDAARPVPAAEIAQVENPELRARLELHAKLWHERESARLAELAKNEPPVESKWCQPQSPKIVITPEIVLAKKFICHCGKSYTLTMLKPIQEGDKLVSVIPRHKPTNKVEVSVLPPPLPPAPPPALQMAPPPPLAHQLAHSEQQIIDFATDVSDDEDEEEEVAAAPLPPAPPPPPVSYVNGVNEAFQAQAAGEFQKMLGSMLGSEGQTMTGRTSCVDPPANELIAVPSKEVLALGHKIALAIAEFLKESK